VTAAAEVLADAGGAVAPSAGGASAEELLAQALVVIGQQAAEIGELREENAQLVRVNDELRELVGSQAARLAEVNESLAILQKMVFGRKPEKNRPEPAGGEDGEDPAGEDDGAAAGGSKKKVKRGPGARAGAAGLLAPAEGRGHLGFPGRRVLLPGLRGAVYGAGQ